MSHAAGIRLFTADDAETWYRPGERQIFLGDVVDASSSDSMTVGFARYAPGESNEWTVTYDEALIITKGAFTVTSAEGVETTARPGEVIFLRTGTPVVYSAKEEGAELVYVTYPHWSSVPEASEAFARAFQPSDEPPPRTDARALVEASFGPRDGLPDFDVLADDVVFTTQVGEVRGKQAVIDYFSRGAATIDFEPFVRPPEYVGDGNRVVQLGREVFKVKATGVTHEGEWAWVFDVHDGRITRINAIQDLSGIADDIAAALTGAQKEAA
jgi:ethanolamine utilization protein EutQ